MYGRKYGNLFIEKKPWTTSRQMQRKNSQMLSIQVLATNREIYIPLTALSLHPFLFTVGLWSEWSKSLFWGLRTLKPLTWSFCDINCILSQFFWAQNSIIQGPFVKNVPLFFIPYMLWYPLGNFWLHTSCCYSCILHVQCTLQYKWL